MDMGRSILYSIQTQFGPNFRPHPLNLENEMVRYHPTSLYPPRTPPTPPKNLCHGSAAGYIFPPIHRHTPPIPEAEWRVTECKLLSAKSGFLGEKHFRQVQSLSIQALCMNKKKDHISYFGIILLVFGHVHGRKWKGPLFFLKNVILLGHEHGRKGPLFS